MEGVKVKETEIIRVRYWAAARAAAGVAEDDFETDGPTSLGDVVGWVTARRPDAARVIAACSTLVDDLPSGMSDPAEVVVHPGQTVEFLPPFAGG